MFRFCHSGPVLTHCHNPIDDRDPHETSFLRPTDGGRLCWGPVQADHRHVRRESAELTVVRPEARPGRRAVRSRFARLDRRVAPLELHDRTVFRQVWGTGQETPDREAPPPSSKMPAD